MKRSKDMDLTEKQRERAERIDVFVKSVIKNGGSDEDILIGMYGFANDLKILMDELPSSGLNALYHRYDGFYRFAKLLESLAGGLQRGEIKI